MSTLVVKTIADGVDTFNKKRAATGICNSSLTKKGRKTLGERLVRSVPDPVRPSQVVCNHTNISYINCQGVFAQGGCGTVAKSGVDRSWRISSKRALLGWNKPDKQPIRRIMQSFNYNYKSSTVTAETETAGQSAWPCDNRRLIKRYSCLPEVFLPFSSGFVFLLLESSLRGCINAAFKQLRDVYNKSINIDHNKIMIYKLWALSIALLLTTQNAHKWIYIYIL